MCVADVAGVPGVKLQKAVCFARTVVFGVVVRACVRA